MTRREILNNWRTLLAAHVGVAFGLAPLGITYSLGTFAKPLAESFGWGRGDVMFATIPAFVGMLLISPLVGWISDHYGIRKLIMVGQIALGLCFLALGTIVNSLLVFYMIYFVMHLVAGGTAFVTFAKTIATHFESSRGLALGLALAGTGTCGFLAPSYITFFLNEFGWQGGYIALSALPMLLAMPLVYFFLPEPKVQHTDPQEPAKSGGAEGLSVREALMGWRYWLLGTLFAGIGFFVTGLITNLVPMLTDSGYSNGDAAALAGAVGLSVIVGRVSVGSLIDQFWAPAVGCLFVLMPSLACMIFLMLPDSGLIILSAIILVGLATGAEIDLNAFMTSRYFGNRAYGQLFSGQYIMIVVGAATSSPVFGYVYDHYGTYDLILKISAIGFTLTAFSLLFLGPYPIWKRQDEPGGASGNSSQ